MNGETTALTSVQKGKVKQVIIATIVVTIVSMILGMLTCGWLFRWVYELSPVGVWKFGPGISPNPVWLTLGNLVMALILVLVYALVSSGIPGKGTRKGMNYGFIVWLLSLGGMWAVLMFMTVNPGVVLYWTILGLVILLIEGAIIGAIVK